MEATFWYESRYANGYLGAFSMTFLLPAPAADPPRSCGTPAPASRQHTLRKLWGFKYDQPSQTAFPCMPIRGVNVNLLG